MHRLCRFYYVLLFCEVKSWPRRYLLLRFYGRNGRSQDGRLRDTAKAVQRRSRRVVHSAQLYASLGAGAPSSDVGRQPGRTYAPVFVSCFVKAHPPALGIVAKTP